MTMTFLIVKNERGGPRQIDMWEAKRAQSLSLLLSLGDREQICGTSALSITKLIFSQPS